MTIYKTTNIINGKIYVGKEQTEKRTYLGSGIILKKAIEKYGKDNFKKEVIEKCGTHEELCEREIYWIRELNATNKQIGYNIALGGAGGDTYSNNPNYDQIIEKLTGENNGFYGKKHNSKTRQKMAKARLGKPAWNSGKKSVYFKETIEKMSKARTIEIDLQNFKILLLTRTNVQIQKYLNISHSLFYKCLKQLKEKDI